MKKTLLSLLFSLLIPVFCLAQNPVRYQYYAGDTLNGFDLAKTYTDVLLFSQQHHLTLKEQNNLMYAKEKTFVRLKYHLPLPKQEKAGHLVMRVNPSLLSTCNNVDFETGDYTGWTGAYGYNSNSSSPLAILSPTISTLGTNSPEGSCAYHTIVTSAIGNDPYGLFPQLDPSGGNDAERLGGESINQYGGSDYTGTYSCSGGAYDGTNLCSGGEYIQQSFPVTTSNAMFSYSYAVVLHDGGHSTGEQPYFRVEVLDNLGNPLPCLQYYQECNNGTPPPGYSTSSLNSSVFYLPWKSNTLNLKPYIGTNVTVRFTAAGCIYGGHFGYAYIDATCGPLQLIATTPPSCPPAAPSATFTAPNGGVTYTWAKVPPGAGIVGSTTGQSVTINQNGTYQVTVTTGGGCSYIMDTTISFPVSPSLTVTETNVTCNGLSNGTAGVTATLGTAPYTYSWSPSGGTSSTISGLSTGTYTVTVTTASGCSAKTTTTVAQPAVITASTAQVNVSCSGGSNGSATITPAGGTPAYTYSWSPAGGSGATATGLAAGTYSCTITDIHGCTKTTSVTITQPAGTTITTTQTNVSCNSGTDGTGGVTVTGGTAPYTYSWSPAGGSGSTASGLSAGIYTCYVTDAGGCTNSGTVVISQPAALAFTTSQINEPCDGSLSGSATVNASGGTAPYTYSWSPAGGVASTSSILGAGTYTCTIKDHNGCTTPAVITLTQPAALAVTTSGIAASCNSGANGSATITASGGTPGYSYSWSPSGGSSAIASGLIAGTYTCMVTDNHGCNTSG
ncbi:MAG TPA: SprB repeat-containing protein, partial [Bacteroidia bacterium]|nr:SprB repeat-containing protein [Bacteroidia bacterium]